MTSSVDEVSSHVPSAAEALNIKLTYETTLGDSSEISVSYSVTPDTLKINLSLSDCGRFMNSDEAIYSPGSEFISRDNEMITSQNAASLMMHWGIRSTTAGWRAPSTSEARYPTGSSCKAPGACRSLFYISDSNLEVQFMIPLSELVENVTLEGIPFVLYDPVEKKYHKRPCGKDFLIPLRCDELNPYLFPPTPEPSVVLSKLTGGGADNTILEDKIGREWYIKTDGGSDSRLTAYKHSDETDLWLIFLFSSHEKYLIHWGLCGVENNGWKQLEPFNESFSSDSEVPFNLGTCFNDSSNLGKSWKQDDKSRQSSFVPVPSRYAEGYNHYQMCVLRLPGTALVILSEAMTINLNFAFVLQSTDTNRWCKSDGFDFILGPLAIKETFHKHSTELLTSLRTEQMKAEQIIQNQAIMAKEFNYVLETFNLQRAQRRKPFDELKKKLEKGNDQVSVSHRRDSRLYLLRSASLADERGSAQYSIRPLSYKSFSLADGEGQLDVMISAKLTKKPNEPITNSTRCDLQIEFLACLRQDAVLHWGVMIAPEDQADRKQRPSEWNAPNRCYPLDQLPLNTVQIDGMASQTPLEQSTALQYPKRYSQTCITEEESSESTSPTFQMMQRELGQKRELLVQSSIPLRVLNLYIPAEIVDVEDDVEDGEGPGIFSIRPKSIKLDGVSVFPYAVSLVLKGKDGKWAGKESGGNIVMTLRPHRSLIAWKGMNREIPEICVEAETLWSHMTLMHRSNLFSEHVERWLTDKKLKAVTSKRVAKRSRSSSFGEYEDVYYNPENDIDFWSWFVVWGRMSQVRLLDWQRNYNTKPRDLAGATQALTTKLATIWSTFSHSPIRSWVRLFMMTLPRGGDGGTGQAIRDEILNIQHRHHIPETSGHFYEQWHQKLHNNTTPDDVPICKALISFLRSGGDTNVFVSTLKHEGLSLERMASYDRKITAMPYVPHCDTSALIGDLERYLVILKNVHDALDVDASYSYASAHLNDGQRGVCTHAIELLKNESRSSEVGYALAEARRCIHRSLKSQRDGSAVRDILLLDFSFETQQVLVAHKLESRERFRDKPLTELHPALNVVIQLLEGAVIHYPTEMELKYIISDLHDLSEHALKWPEHPNRYHGESDAALVVLSVLDRAHRWLADISNSISAMIIPKISFLAENILDDKDGNNHPEVPNFLDELLRGTFLSAVASALQKLDITCRAVARMTSFQILSRSASPRFNARVVRIPCLSGLQDHIYTEPTLMICDIVDGSEDIPSGVVGIVAIDSAFAPDLLSHVAVRARNCSVMMVVVHDDGEKGALLESDGSMCGVELKANGAIILGETIPEDIRVASPSSPQHKKDKPLTQFLTESPNASEFGFISTEAFTPELVGGKSFNLERLKQQVSDLTQNADFKTLVDIPDGRAFPFGSLTSAIRESEAPAGLLESILATMRKISPNDSTEVVIEPLNEISELIASMKMTPKTEAVIIQALEGLGCSSADAGLEHHWNALKACWSSCFHPRPWAAMLKSHLHFSDLQMCVLVQKVYPACMSFVLHTRDPCSDESNLVGELVFGLGEVLVGNEPGGACMWTVPHGTTGTDQVQVKAYSSKSSALLTDDANFIFRSDSNSEDREGFAGAGLFESVPSKPFHRKLINYSAPGQDFPLVEQFYVDKNFRSSLLRFIADVGFGIEKVFGKPMDVEGVVYQTQASDTEYHIGIVQARPQV
eukprot:GHVH01007657.1.p1 GENE.GHVH01007657.1~~GHVH01007657.1.p1  ORF type:complete len:1702 (+),score=221.33 GHVH01007657.1:115-5220(+)